MADIQVSRSSYKDEYPSTACSPFYSVKNCFPPKYLAGAFYLTDINAPFFILMKCQSVPTNTVDTFLLVSH